MLQQADLLTNYRKLKKQTPVSKEVSKFIVDSRHDEDKHEVSESASSTNYHAGYSNVIRECRFSDYPTYS